VSHDPLINLSVDEFLKPILMVYERNGIKMGFSKLEGGILYINADKRACGG